MDQNPVCKTAKIEDFLNKDKFTCNLLKSTKIGDPCVQKCQISIYVQQNQFFSTLTVAKIAFLDVCKVRIEFDPTKKKLSNERVTKLAKASDRSLRIVESKRACIKRARCRIGAFECSRQPARHS